MSESKKGSALPAVGAIAFGIIGAGLGDGGGFVAGAIIGGIWGAIVSMWVAALGLTVEMIKRICSAITTTTILAVVAMLIAVAAIKP